MNKLVIFGVGNYFRSKIKQIKDIANIQIVAYIDNNSLLWGKKIDGIEVTSPTNINNIEFDYVILLSTYVKAMRNQLLELNISYNKIYTFEYFRAEMQKGTIKLYNADSNFMLGQRKILIITTDMDYAGGIMVAVYAAIALKVQGYYVVIAAPSCDLRMLNEISENGITIAICPALPYIYEKEKEWIKHFDVVIVNVFQMICSACEISKFKPVIWWIHENKAENSPVYRMTREAFPEYDSSEKMSNVDILAVSEIARHNFNFYYPKVAKKSLVFGIPDRNIAPKIEENNKIVFAVIGVIAEGKAQAIFAEAAMNLEKYERENAEFWLIGRYSDNEYYRKLNNMAMNFPQLKILGVMTRQEIYIAYQNIDVVVCSSMEETMSITIVEGMMCGKACITTDATGVAEYIVDGKNGLICHSGDENDLKDKMSYLINNTEKRMEMGIEARKTYEEYFTLEKFGERLEDEIDCVLKDYKR